MQKRIIKKRWKSKRKSAKITCKQIAKLFANKRKKVIKKRPRTVWKKKRKIMKKKAKEIEREWWSDKEFKDDPRCETPRFGFGPDSEPCKPLDSDEDDNDEDKEEEEQNDDEENKKIVPWNKREWKIDPQYDEFFEEVKKYDVHGDFSGPCLIDRDPYVDPPPSRQYQWHSGKSVAVDKADDEKQMELALKSDIKSKKKKKVIKKAKKKNKWIKEKKAKVVPWKRRLQKNDPKYDKFFKELAEWDSDFWCDWDEDWIPSQGPCNRRPPKDGEFQLHSGKPVAVDKAEDEKQMELALKSDIKSKKKKKAAKKAKKAKIAPWNKKKKLKKKAKAVPWKKRKFIVDPKYDKFFKSLEEQDSFFWGKADEWRIPSEDPLKSPTPKDGEWQLHSGHGGAMDIDDLSLFLNSEDID